jgi:hypothetical protein
MGTIIAERGQAGSFLTNFWKSVVRVGGFMVKSLAALSHGAVAE